MEHPHLTVVEVQRFERPVVFRMPFRFGAVTLTQTPQAFVRVRVRLTDGREGWGQAAELMAPKWFDKAPELSNEDNVDQLRRALGVYGDAILGADADTAFGLYAELYRPHLDACGRAGLNPLVASFGPALIDRAVLDAVCRLHGLSFAAAIAVNLPGMAPDRLVAGFHGFDFDRFLAGLRPLSSVAARHTVGLIDPLIASDHPVDQRVGDGLPETLDEVVAHYGTRYFKLKIGGDVAADRDRLKAIAVVLDQSPTPYVATLDGNEQFDGVDPVLELLASLRDDPAMDRFCRSLLFVEQPIHRANALQKDVSRLSGVCPVIIDESDQDLDAFARARALGYQGVSSKSCKGFYKSLINLARCRMWSSDNGVYVMSAEDLSCQAGLSLQQDLALVALLGIDHVERNGHHYVRGMSDVPRAEQEAFLSAHGDTYAEVGGVTCLRITDGRIAIDSAQAPGFGTTVEPQWQSMHPMP